MQDSGNAVGDAIDVVQGKADARPRLIATGLLTGSAAPEDDRVGSELGEDGLDGVTETGAIGDQQHDGGDAPGHADHGDGGAAAVVDHRLPGLSEDVLEHDSSSCQPNLLSPQRLDG